MAEIFPFFGRITEPLYGTTSNSQDFAVDDIVRIIDGTADAYLAIPENVQDDGTDPTTYRAYASWVLQSSVRHLCDICEDQDSVQAGALNHGMMLCAACAESEPEWEREYQADCDYQAAMQRLLAAQGSNPWHLEEA